MSSFFSLINCLRSPNWNSEQTANIGEEESMSSDTLEDTTIPEVEDSPIMIEELDLSFNDHHSLIDSDIKPEGINGEKYGLVTRRRARRHKW